MEMESYRDGKRHREGPKPTTIEIAEEENPDNGTEQGIQSVI